MAETDELLKEFYELFGENGGDKYPGNIGISRTAANVCHGLMMIGEPVLFDYFKAWDQSTETVRKPSEIEQFLVNIRTMFSADSTRLLPFPLTSRNGD